MTTVVFQPGGGVQTLQVGAADVVSLLSAAHSAWGWIGGLNGVKSILDRTRSVFGINSNKVPTLNLQLPRSNYHIITYKGLIPQPLEDEYKAFGGDPTLQFVGATLCALAHECGSHVAVQLFMKCIAPIVFEEEFEKLPALKSAVQMQLTDNITSILNDGATRGLTERFRAAGERSGLSHGDQVWLREYMVYSAHLAESDGLPSELGLVGGMLKWIVGNDRHANVYQTRSGLVARIATYLREVGFSIDSVRVWNGEGSPPMVFRGVVLVTGGFTDTDSLQLSPEEADEDHPMRISHYQFSTVGSMFVNATGALGDIAPETAQTLFRTVHGYIKNNLVLTWGFTNKELCATFTFSETRRFGSASNGSSPIAISLASIYFPLCAQSLAPCYELCHIATAEVHKCVVEYDETLFDLEDAECPEDLLLFRYVTSSIVLSVLGALGGSGFWTTMHSTALQLRSFVWLKEICESLDIRMKNSSSLKFQDAVPLVATIHTAHEMGDLAYASPIVNIIGARNGIFAVLPALFLNMANMTECVGLKCVDKFVGNLSVHPGGWLKGGYTRNHLFRDADEISTETGPITGFELATTHPQINPHIGAPIKMSPDVPIYISIERDLHYSGPDLMLTGRINGEIVAAMSIVDVMGVIAQSLQDAKRCLGRCDSAATVLNITASEWIGPQGLILHSKHPVYLQVDGDPAWTLFAAGYAAQLGDYIASSCISCTIKEIEKTMDYTGYRIGGARSLIIGGVEIEAGQSRIDKRR